jgi:hypothetical protein
VLLPLGKGRLSGMGRAAAGRCIDRCVGRLS